MTAAQVTKIENLTDELATVKSQLEAERPKEREATQGQPWANLECKLRLPSDLNDLQPSEYNGNKSVKFSATPLVWDRDAKSYREGRGYYFEAKDNGFGALASEVERRIQEGQRDIIVRARYDTWVYNRNGEDITCDKFVVVTISDIPVAKSQLQKQQELPVS